MRNPPDGDDEGKAALFSRRLNRGQLIALDCLAAFGYVLVLLPFSARTGAASGTVLVFAVAMGLPVAVRRLWPIPAFAVALIASVTSLFFDIPRDSFVPAAFTLYLVALTVHLNRRWLTTAIGVATIALGLLMSVAGTVTTYAAVADGLLGAVALGVAWTLGRAIRDRRAHAERVARRLAADLVSQERLHIARELHDVVAHSMSLIAVKAAVANHVAEKRPEEAHKALAVIETTSKTALSEMRRLLGVLRSESDDPAAELAPAPGLAELPALARRAALAGVRVDIQSGVDLSELPTGLDLSAYRIVQEAVTNVVKHAATAHCHVDVSHVDDQLRIRVTDDGPGGRVLPAPGTGHGLVGMAERVAMYGGEFDAAPAPGGGFAVSARIPYPAEVTA